MNCCFLSPPHLMYLDFSGRCRLRHTLVPSAARRHHRRRLLKYDPNHTLTHTHTTIFKLSDETLRITLQPPSNYSLPELENRLNQFLDYGREALDDLRTIVAVNGNNGGVVISCRRSTVEFLIALFFASFVVVTAFRGLFKARNSSGEVRIYKRDRSLGGREVLVGKSETNRSTSSTSTPLSSDNISNFNRKTKNRVVLGRRRKVELPKWWPQASNWVPKEPVDNEEYQRMANQLIRAIMDRKMSGQDISTNDIVQLRYLCKTFGVKTFIDTANARYSLYRVSVNFVLDYCESMSHDSTSIRINGEDVREFIAGLADNIGLESTHAARMVTAAVAARTRSRIVQAWALEVQNKHAEALVELFKVCLIHRIFSPEENSPEMEMVARGLDKSLSLEQREHILNSFITVCGKDIDQSVVEALGLGGTKDEHSF